jgi:hypothetical protein
MAPGWPLAAEPVEAGMRVRGRSSASWRAIWTLRIVAGQRTEDLFDITVSYENI